MWSHHSIQGWWSVMIKVKTNMRGVVPKVRKIATDERVGTFVASECQRLMSPYVPMDTGMLYQQVVIEPFSVTYTQNYAQKVYYGEDIDFNKEKHPLATAKWDVAMFSAKQSELAKTISEYIKRILTNMQKYLIG